MRPHAVEQVFKAMAAMPFLLMPLAGCFELLGSSWESESTITVSVEPDPQGLGREEYVREGIERWTNRLREKGIELRVQMAGEDEADAEANVTYTWWTLANAWGEWQVGMDGYVETGMVYLPAEDDQTCPQFIRNLAEHEMLHVAGIPDVPDGIVTNTNQWCRFRTWSERDEAVWDAFYPRSSCILRATSIGEPAVLQPLASLGHLGPSIATDEQGTWVAVWATRLATTEESSFHNLILLSRSTDLGITWSEPISLAQIAGREITTSLSTDGQGRWVAIWQSADAGALVQARSDDNGVTWSAPQAVVDRGYCSGQAIATDGSTWGVAFAHGDHIELVRSDDAGQTWGESVVVAEPTMVQAGVSWEGYVENGPHLAISPTGTWIIAWTGGETRDDRWTSGGSIYACRSDDHGVTWSKPAPIYNYDEGQGWTNRIRVSTDGTGHWGMIADAQAMCPDSCEVNVDIVLRTSSDDAQTWSPPQVLDTVHTWPDFDILPDGDGQWVVAGLGSQGGGFDAIRLIVGSENAQVWGLPETIGLFDRGGWGIRLASGGQGSWVCLGLGNDAPRAIPFRVRTGL